MQLVVFDVDGTLVDSQDTIVAAQGTAFAACGLEPPSRQRSLSIVGLSLREAFTALVGADGPVESLVDEYGRAFRALHAEPGFREPLFPGAVACLADLAGRPDIRLGIATGKSRRGVARILQANGWQDLFATIQTADDAPSKPDPTMLRQACEATGIPPANATMIGDTTFDMAMARAAGMRAIGVSWGYHPVASLWEAGAETVIDDFAELAPLLRPVASVRPVAAADA